MLNFFLQYAAFSVTAIFGMFYAVQTEIFVNVRQRPGLAFIITSAFFAGFIALKLLLTDTAPFNPVDLILFIFAAYGTLIALQLVLMLPIPESFNEHALIYGIGIVSWAILPIVSPSMRLVLGFD